MFCCSNVVFPVIYVMTCLARMSIEVYSDISFKVLDTVVDQWGKTG